MSDTTSDPARRDGGKDRKVPSPDQDVASGQPYDPRQDPGHDEGDKPGDEGNGDHDGDTRTDEGATTKE